MDLAEALSVLALKPGASWRAVQEAHRDLVKVWHPDRFENDQRLREKAEEELKRINGAFDVLSGIYQEGRADPFAPEPAATPVARPTVAAKDTPQRIPGHYLWIAGGLVTTVLISTGASLWFLALIFLPVLFLQYGSKGLAMRLVKIGVGLEIATGIAIYFVDRSEKAEREKKARWLTATSSGLTGAWLATTRDSGGKAVAAASKIGFRVCNNRDVELTRTSLHAAGRYSGRSADHSIRRSAFADYSSSYSEFASDLVVSPRSCMDISWEGEFMKFDSYAVVMIEGTWRDGESFY